MEFGRLILGRPLRASEAGREEINPVEGLSALSLDALTSVAYGPQALLLALAAGGVAALRLAPWITLAIVALLALLVLSYLQVIVAYPGGGGAYAVARANLGPGLSLLAGASLIVDYTLTVAVSIAAGVASLTSAYPGLTPATVPLCLGILGLITVLNLRGLGEGARAFLLPTLAFIVGLLVVIAIGLVHPLAPHLRPPGAPQIRSHAVEALGALLVLKAFSAGCSALTGVEAIANGVPLFRAPRVRRARQTEILLGVLLGTMLLGLAALVQRFHIQPRANDAVLNQIIGEAISRGWAFDALSIVVTVALALAANTSFGGLPVLGSLLARDHRLPHAFALRGDRLVFSRGIWVLAVLAGALLVATGGNTAALIPLFAIGVFTGFTLAQAGLVHHWASERPRGWVARAALNAVGATATGAATLIFVFTKFAEGAWVVVVTVPLLILLFVRVEAYYAAVGRELRLGRTPPRPPPGRTMVVVPVTDISRLTAEALAVALSISDEVVAVTVSFEDGDPAAELTRHWEHWAPGVPLVVVRSPYHSVARPLLSFVRQQRPSAQRRLVVLIPVVVPRRFWHAVLHNHLDLVLSATLRHRRHVVVARLPLFLRNE